MTGAARATRLTIDRGAAVLRAYATWLALAGSFALVFTLYRRALAFSFLFDDTIDLTRVEGRGYWSLLSSSEGYAYYRPLPFLIWKALRDAQGHYDQFTLHLLPLVAHALAGWLLYLLVKRLGAGEWAVVPAILFVTCPFHYQNLAVVGTLFHPMAGAAILGSLVLYQAARTSCVRTTAALHVAALAVTSVALWTHESGILVAPALVGLEAALLWQSRRRRPSPWLAGHLALAALFGLAWLAVEKAPFTDQTTLAELRPKGLFFLQGFTYPLSAQLGWLRDNAGIPFGITIGHWGVLDVGLIALAIGAAAYLLSWWRTRSPGLPLVPAAAIGVGLLASAPALLRLSWPYVENSPRLLYLVAMGSAVFFGLLPSLSFGNAWVTRAWRVVTLVLLLGVVAQSWRFVDIRLTMWEHGSAMIDELVAVGERYNGRELLVLNTPSWFAQGSYEYPYGHYGVQLIPSYIGLERVIYASSEHRARTDARSATRQAQVSGGRYSFGPHGPELSADEFDSLLRQGYAVAAVERAGDGFRVREVGALRTGSSDFWLDTAGHIADHVRPSYARAAIVDGDLIVQVEWHVLRRLPPGDYATEVEVRNERGELVGSYTGDALAGLSAPRLWDHGDVVHDSFLIDDPLPGRYAVLAGIRRMDTGELLPALDAGGRPVQERLVPVGAIVVGDGEVIALESAP